ncbi:AGZA family xanthine/uracil permease-like MFS transporter [Kribbella amoyensis]|uniref:AGZA family xanthine/uracil permease-like MFS transporter n=1 Tax=Kribbella amoyensis TaxID=996641 RepID=A0A561BK70_9ACTN|nr:NCS2 family permease [Kribbella amoyensis]TWD79245.1 AGZA family xanthine/uracil permease-like MFS transporter [Kribbella amoyensis]
MTSPQAVTERPRAGFLDSFFKISDRGSTFGREIRGGLVTFFTMAYIVVLNPLIIGTVKDGSGQYVGGGTDPTASIAKIAVATALVAGIVTILMGLVANFPLALATGLGLNAFLAFSVATKMTWADAMGLVVLEGLIILILVLTGFRRAVFEAVPLQLKVAISVGIGLFIAFIGVIDAGFVRRPEAPTGPPVELGVGGSLRGWPVLIFVVGLLLIVTLYARKVKGAILIGILAATVLAIAVEAIVGVGARSPENPGGWGLSVPKLPTEWFSKPNLDTIGEFNLFGSFEKIGLVSALLLIFTLMLADFFDTMGTMTAIGAEANLLDDSGNPPNAQRILIVDSVAAAAGGAASVSSNTSYIESASGVGEGARTGLASVVTGICFLISMVVAPLVTLVPYEAATPALILVGFLMMTQVKGIDFDDLEVGVPAFLTIILMPFTYSISAGIGAGFVAYVVLKVVRGKARQVHPLMWVVSALFVIYFAIGPLGDWLT